MVKNKIIRVEKEMESLDVSERNVKLLSNFWFNRIVESERDKVMMILMKKFGKLRWEDLEEIYMDGCMILWERVGKGEMKEMDGGVVNYLLKICKNVGMHYVRGLRDDVVSLDVLLGERVENGLDDDEERCGLDVMFGVIEEGVDDGNEKVMRKLQMAWEKLSDVDRVILVSYYWEGMKMEDIVKRIGYQSVDSVKSKKCKCLKKILGMMKEKKVVRDEQPSFFEISACSLEIGELR